MRLTVLAFTLLPVDAYAQDTTLPAPIAPLAQSHSCPVGMAWDAASSACLEVAEATNSPMKDLGGHSGCNYGAAREVTS